MKKCRNLVRNLKTLMIILAFSMLFHVPVSASSSSGLKYEYGTWKQYTVPADVQMLLSVNEWLPFKTSKSFRLGGMAYQQVNLSDYIPLTSGQYYEFRLDGLDWNPGFFQNNNFSYGKFLKEDSSGAFYDVPGRGGILRYTGNNAVLTAGWTQNVYFNPTLDADGSYYIGLGQVRAGYRGNYKISVRSVTISSGSTFQEGYNSGYTAGLSEGKEIGYSDGFKNGVASVDTGKFYDDGYKDGVASVDTDKFYNDGYQAGYNSGYQEAYSKGFNDGYDSGYQAAMDRIEGWGADGTQYPVLVDSYRDSSNAFNIGVEVLSDYVMINDRVYNLGSLNNASEFKELVFDFEINPNHVYKIVSTFHNFHTSESGDGYFGDFGMNLQVGSSEFPLNICPYLDGSSGSYETVSYIRGDSMGNIFRYEFFLNSLNFMNNTNGGIISFFLTSDLEVSVYDCGPTGDTQNHIANQTDQLTHGYDPSVGNDSNNKFSGGAGNFQNAENNLFQSASDGLKDFKFFDLNSIPAVVTGLSFVASLMTSIFGAMGGMSGAGIVLSVLYCVVFVTIIIGLRRYYNSSGDVKDGSFRQLDESTLLEDKGRK